MASTGNNQIFPLAFGIGDSENDASWMWFFENLEVAIGVCEDLVLYPIGIKALKCYFGGFPRFFTWILHLPSLE